MDAAEQRLWELLDHIVEGSCTDAEQQEFAQLTDEHRHLAPELVEQLRTHTLLQWHCGAANVGMVPDCTIERSSSIDGPLQSWPAQVFRFSAKRWIQAAAALALVIGAAVVWQLLQRAGGKPLVVAEIVEGRLVDWTANTTALREDGIVAGRLEMKSGKLTLRFRSGATISTSGDVSMQIESDMRLRLDRGQATAHVPQWAQGFTIQTADVEVIDLGTKFGVVARSGGATDVVVFEGQVDLKTTGNAGIPQKRLSQGEGVRVSNQGSIDRLFELQSDAAGDEWTTDLATGDKTTFKSIRDNIPSSDSPTYYHITPRGLNDDCRAYVDAPHEWNGVFPDGLPEFLRHADYVRTFNDYRYINELVVTVELARPAVVYVFFDHRVEPPSWLTEQFENISVDIGLDEGPWSKGDAKHIVAGGGGQSIDRLFSVWQRRCAKPETLMLGAMGKKPGARAMYGIAAQPLD